MVTLPPTFHFPLCLFTSPCIFTSPTTFYFTITLHSSFSLSYNLILFLPILFCINLISFPPFNPYFFPHKNYEYSLSLLSFGEFLFFLITLIKVDFLKICVLVLCFSFPSQNLPSPFYSFG